MDFSRSAKEEDNEPFFHISTSSGAMNSGRAAAPAATKQPQQQPPLQQVPTSGFDFSADDVLPSFDFQPLRRSGSFNTRSNSSPRLEPSVAVNNSGANNSGSRRHRSSGSPVYLTGELFSSRKEADMDSYNSVIVSAVERTIKKYADNILRVLEGMSGRLSQLESITQDLEQSVESLKTAVDDYHSEDDVKIRTLNNHVIEMHRAVQILRDKQDIIETHAELAKLRSSKADVTLEKSIAERPASNQLAVTQQITEQQKQHQQLPSAVVPSAVQATPSMQLQLPFSSQEEIANLNESAGQLQHLPSSLPISTPQQYVPMQTSAQQQQPQQLQVSQQQAQQFHVQQQHQQPQQLHMQQQQAHQLLIQPQSEMQQGQILQTSQPLPMHVQQQQAQGLQSHPHQGLMQHFQQGQFQVVAPPPSGLQTQSEQVQLQVASNPMQMQQALPQQVATQLPSPLPHASHSASTPYTPVQQMPTGQALVQPNQGPQVPNPQLQVQQRSPPIASIGSQNSVQLPPHMQSMPGSQPPLQNLPPNPGSFQQFTHQSENQSHIPIPYRGAVQAPFSHGAVGAGTGPQQPPHLTQAAYQTESPYQRSAMALPPPPSPYGSSWKEQNIPSSWKEQNVPPNARPLPVAQPIRNEPAGSGVGNSPIDALVEKVAAMGFSRDQVRSVIRNLSDRGQVVDMNVVVDTLVNGDDQSQRRWQGR